MQIASEEGNTIKKFLNIMLRITKVIIMASIKACKTEEQAETIHLLRKHSSVNETEKKQAKKKAESTANQDIEGF